MSAIDRRVERRNDWKTDLLDLVVPLERHPEVTSSDVHVGVLDEEPEALHLDEVSRRGRGVFLLVSKKEDQSRARVARTSSTLL